MPIMSYKMYLSMFKRSSQSWSIKPLPLIVSLLFTLGACTTTPSKSVPEQSAAEQTTAVAEVEAEEVTDSDKTAAPAEDTKTIIEDKPLTSPFIYRYLLGEIAGQRGDYEQSSHIFYQLALSEKDPRFAERAAKIAAFGHVGNLLYPSVRLWAELAPESREAQQAITEILIRGNKIAEAEPHLSNLLQDEKTRAAGFILMGKLLNQSAEKAAVLQLVQNLAAPYPELPESHIAIAQSAMQAEETALAMQHLDQAETLRPGWNLPALLKGQLLFKSSVPDAIHFHETFLKKYPDVNDVRLNFARALVQHQQFERAKTEFPIIIQNARATLARTDALDDTNRKAKQKAQKAAEKNLADTLAMIGLMSFQGEDYNSANSYFKEALDFNFYDPDQIYLYFGQTAESLNRPAIAKQWYETVAPGKHYVPAQLNIANQIKQASSVDTAIEYLNTLDHLNLEQQTVVTQAQAAMLHEKQRHQDAFLLLKKAVDEKPQSTALVYDYALAAERVQEYTVMEAQLRNVIHARPDFAPAYNALGYSFADRNIKLEEALTLIKKALSIAPGDHYMLDSLGWIYYRMGELATAEQHLQKAYDIQADPEIAAHLGEVLWQQGKHEAAEKIWQKSLEQYPDNATLLSTIKKYQD